MPQMRPRHPAQTGAAERSAAACARQTTSKTTAAATFTQIARCPLPAAANVVVGDGSQKSTTIMASQARAAATGGHRRAGEYYGVRNRSAADEKGGRGGGRGMNGARPIDWMNAAIQSRPNNKHVACERAGRGRQFESGQGLSVNRDAACHNRVRHWNNNKRGSDARRLFFTLAGRYSFT